MQAPRDTSHKDRRSQMRDAALYGAIVAVVVFVLLLIVMPGWIAPFVFAVLAGALALMFFLWSDTDGFVKFSDDAAQRIAQRTGRSAPSAGGHVGAGDPGGVDPGMPVAEDRGGETAEEAAKAFEADTDTGAVTRDMHDHRGAGDPGGVDPGMPVAEDGTGGESAREAARAFEEASEADGPKGRARGHSGAGDPGGVDPAMPDDDDGGAESAEDAAAAFMEPDVTGQAARAEGRKPELLDAPEGGSGDDLKEIRGIGPKLEGMLHDLGVWHFRQIASWGPAEVAWVDDHLEGFNGRVDRDEWVAQAKVLAAGGDTEFSERVDRGDVY